MAAGPHLAVPSHERQRIIRLFEIAACMTDRSGALRIDRTDPMAHFELNPMAEWNPQANDIFVRAVEIDAPVDRRLFLEQQCGGDAALRAQVDSLLAAGGKVGSFLEKPAVPAPPAGDRRRLDSTDTSSWNPESSSGFRRLYWSKRKSSGNGDRCRHTHKRRRMFSSHWLKHCPSGSPARWKPGPFRHSRNAVATTQHPAFR